MYWSSICKFYSEKDFILEVFLELHIQKDVLMDVDICTFSS